MISEEARKAELNGDLGTVAAWLKHRFPGVGRITLHAGMQDEAIDRCMRHVFGPLVAINGCPADGVIADEARRCLCKYGWTKHWYRGSPIAVLCWSDARRLSAHELLDVLVYLENGDPAFAPS